MVCMLLLLVFPLSRLVWFESFLGPLELHLEALGANLQDENGSAVAYQMKYITWMLLSKTHYLEAVHRLDGRQSAHRVVVRHES